MSVNSRSKTSTHRASFTLVLLAVLVVLSSTLCRLVASAASPSEGVAGDGELASPKRQYFIAPRIGRSSANTATIWSALEEAAFQSAGQLQPHRGYPNPLRSSLLFLVGNRRARSTGLLPQARIGRRAAPIGLMPQPRVGRRSDPSELQLEFGNELGGQQEVALAALSDSSLSDTLESLVESG